jgi:hypothetical protein
MKALNIFLGVVAAFCSFVLNNGWSAPIPGAEKLLPEDTLALVTTPDFVRLRDIYLKSPQSQLWNDPAMKPFREKFFAKMSEELIKPLERELSVRVADYTNLAQGQLSLAVIQNGWQGTDEQPLGLLLLLDTRDKSNQLKKSLAELRQKWLDSGKKLKTEKIRDHEFSVLPMSGNDMPKTLRRFFPRPLEVQEVGPDGEPKKVAPNKTELVIGQVDSLLVAGNSLKVVEKIVIRLTGGALPSLGELASYQANHVALFREAPIYGWVNAKAFVEIMTRKSSDTKDSETPDPFAPMKPEKIIAASGLGALKTIAFNAQDSSQGILFQLFLSAPESSRQGVLKILAPEPREAGPPPFIPGDVVKYRRWRLDGQKAWVTLEKMLKDISPQAVTTLNFLLDTANETAKQKDPGFDLRKNLIGNLGDDLITYEKAPRGNTAAELNSPPSLLLLGSPKPEQMVAALKSVLGFLSSQSGAPTEREFLGRKINSIPVPNLPLGLSDGPKPTGQRTLSYAASGGYLAFSTDPAMIEEYLRSSESQAKTLRETPGLTEAAQRVGGTGTGFFGFENQAETMRTTFETLKKEAASTNATANAMSQLPGALGIPTPQVSFKEWMDFSLLPPYDRLAKYFHFSVYAGSATVDGLAWKMFTPVPPGAKR